MDPTLLGTLISAALVAIYHVLFTGKTPPAAVPVPANPSPSPQPTPSAPTASPSPAPAPAPAAPSADPFAGLPGLPGHPLFNGLIGPFLAALLQGQQQSPATSVSACQAATSALATMIKSDPATLAQMQALLGAPAAAK